MNERKLRRFCTAMILFAMLTRLLGGVGAGRFAFSEDSAEAETRVWPVRLLAAKDGTVIAAGFSGKAKTVAQFVSILYMLAALEFSTWQHTLLASLALPDSLFTPVRFLTTAIASEMSYAGVGTLWRQALYSVGLVLFLFIMLINVILNLFIKNKKEG